MIQNSLRKNKKSFFLVNCLVLLCCIVLLSDRISASIHILNALDDFRRLEEIYKRKFIQELSELDWSSALLTTSTESSQARPDINLESSDALSGEFRAPVVVSSNGEHDIEPKADRVHHDYLAGADLSPAELMKSILAISDGKKELALEESQKARRERALSQSLSDESLPWKTVTKHTKPVIFANKTSQPNCNRRLFVGPFRYFSQQCTGLSSLKGVSVPSPMDASATSDNFRSVKHLHDRLARDGRNDFFDKPID